MRRAQFLELDFLIAILILVAGILVLKGQYIHTYENPQVGTAATDVNKLLRTTTLGDLDPGYVAPLQQSLQGTSVNATNETSIARLAAMLYITGRNEGNQNLQDEARSLLQELSDEAGIATSYNVTIHSNNQRYNLFSNSAPLNKTATTTRSLLSGFQVGRPLVGHTATAYLSKGGTTRHAITRIGGFLGQGNITLQLDIPSHADTIDELYLEGEFHQDFTISVNSHHCDDINDGHVTTTLSCENRLTRGANDITITFTGGTMADHYASGGLIRATYTSDEHYTATDTIRKNLPAIEGIANIYDAIMIPGRPTSMEARLRYRTDHSQHDNNVILTIGNTTIHEDDTSTTQQDVHLDNDDFENNLDYDDLEDATVPLRFGYENATTITIVEGASDTILVTDVSDSMDEEICEDTDTSCTYDYRVYPTMEGFVTCNLYSWQSCQGDVCRYDRPQWWNWDILQTRNHDTVTTCNYEYEETTEQSRLESCYIGVDEECQGNACEANGVQDEDTYDHYSYASDGSCRYDFQYPRTVSRHEDGCVIPQLNHNCQGDPCENIPSYATSSSTSDEQSQEYWTTATCTVASTSECTGDRCGDADGADTQDHTTTPRYATGSCGPLAEEQPCEESTCDDAPPDASNYRRVGDECRYDYPDGYRCSYDYHAGTRCEYDYTYTYTRDDDAYCSLTYLQPDESCEQGEGDVCDDAPPDAFNFHDYEEREARQYCRYRYTADITSWTDTSCVLAQGETCSDDVCGDADGNPTRGYNTRESCGYDYSASYDNPTRSGTTDCPLNPGDDCEDNYCNEEVDDDEVIRTNSHQEETEQDCTTRLELAKDVQQEFVTDVLDSGDNSIGLVTYDDAVEDTHPLSDDESSLTQAIEHYTPRDSETCIACGISEAIRRLENSDTSYQSIVLLSDGIPNQCYDDPYDEFPDYLDCPSDLETLDWDERQALASQQAIDYAQYAVDQGYSIYTIFFRDEDDPEFDEGNQTMLDIAATDNSSHHYVGGSTQGLIDAYDDIQSSILEEGGYEAQVATLDDPGLYLDLLGGSYVEVEYEPWEDSDVSGQILIQGELSPFTSDGFCTAMDIDFPPGIQPYDGFVTSYSGDHWTDRLRANGDTVYDLSSMGDDYQAMGDPFAVQLPPGTLDQDGNVLSVRVSGGPEEGPQACSPHNALYYNAFLDSTISLDAVYPRADGCTWTITMDDGDERHYPIPSSYSGGDTCTYPGPYDDEDAWQALGHQLFTNLDLDGDGRIDVDFAAADLQLHAEQRSDIPYLWGPAVLEVTAWN